MFGLVWFVACLFVPCSFRHIIYVSTFASAGLRDVSREICGLTFAYFRLGAQQPHQQIFTFSWKMGSSLEARYLNLEAAPPRFHLLFDSGALRAVCHLPLILALWYRPGFEGLSVAPTLDQHFHTRALRASQVGCGDGEDVPAKLLFLKIGLGPGARLNA